MMYAPSKVIYPIPKLSLFLQEMMEYNAKKDGHEVVPANVGSEGCNTREDKCPLSVEQFCQHRQYEQMIDREVCGTWSIYHDMDSTIPPRDTLVHSEEPPPPPPPRWS